MSLVTLTQPEGTKNKEAIIMNRLFAETYAKDQEIEARYDAAELKNDQAAMEQARADASKRMISRSRPRKYFSLSRDFLYSLYSGFSSL